VIEFWWQVSWRVPQIAPGTTLAVHYAGSGVPEDYVAWGPANLIYYPEAHAERPVQPELSAIILSPENIARVRSRANGGLSPGRATVSDINYRNVLVMSQPTAQSCVHVYESTRQQFSLYEDNSIMLVAGASNIENVKVNYSPRRPPAAVFGEEPEHGWCYYFEQADLAQQQGNWLYVAHLGDDAQAKGLHPNDAIEWMPFLEAYARLGKASEVKNIARRMSAESYYARQACALLIPRADTDALLMDPAMEAQVQELFCAK
jgi:hypothetical protein